VVNIKSKLPFTISKEFPYLIIEIISRRKIINQVDEIKIISNSK